ncbi:MAG TPA: bifunctional diguanylate cyclase/phosphodiesterase [Halomonas sp.]|nr:bifunctional diguanylate cyclase/phosphodiesterase [Halomonas sp.]
MTGNSVGPQGGGGGANLVRHPAAIARLVADKGPMASVLLDHAARILWSNERFQRLAEASADDLRGQRLADLLQLLPGMPDESRAQEGDWQCVWLTPGGAKAPRLVLMSETRPASTEEEDVRLLTFIDAPAGSGRSAAGPALADPQTGLTSRWVFEDRVGHALERADRSGQKVAVLLMRLGHADRLQGRGEAAVQLLLQQISRRLSGTLRAEDSVAYLGNYRWGAMLEHPVSPDRLQMAALRCLEAMEAPLASGTPPLLMTLSIGIAIYPTDGEAPAELLDAAEQALGHAEPGRWAFLDRRLRRQLDRRLALRASLQEALLAPERHLEVVYRPQRQTKAWRCLGVEGLVRWQRPPRGGQDLAGLLAQMAEPEEGVRLGRWAIEQAAWQHQQWRAQRSLLAELDITLAIDARLLTQTAFGGRTLDRFLAELQMPLDWLTLQVDSQSLEALSSEHSLLLRRIARLGVRLSVGNLGGSAVSLQHLARLPITAVTLSRQLVERSRGRGQVEPSDYRMLDALAASLQRLGLAMTADGVDMPKQLEAACLAGVERVQGRLVGSAMSAEALQRWLSGRGVEAP